MTLPDQTARLGRGLQRVADGRATAWPATSVYRGLPWLPVALLLFACGEPRAGSVPGNDAALREASAAPPSTRPDAPTPVSIVHTYAPTFEAVFSEILQPICGGPFCHVGTELFLDAANRDGAYGTLVGAVTSSPGCGFTGLTRVVPGHPERSLLYLKLTDPPCGRKMPLTYAGTLDAREIEQVRLWIERGALRHERPMDASLNDASAEDAAIRDASPSGLAAP